MLSVPAVLTGVLGLGGFQLADLAFLAALGDAQVAAAGAANQTLRQIFQVLVMGVVVSTQMWVARAIGQRNVDTAEHMAGQSFLVGGGIALVGAFVGGLFPEQLISLIARDPEVIQYGAIYVRILFLTLGGMIGVQLVSAVLGGAGDTTTPMVISLIITPLSIFAEWVLAFGHLGAPAMGMVGIGLGAAIGQGCGLAVATWVLATGRCRVHLRARHFVPDLRAIRDLLGFSWQPAMHMVARSLMLVFFMWLAGTLSGKVQAAYTIGLRIEMVAVLMTFAIANACATLVGQNLGAGDLPRAWRAIKVSSVVAMVSMWPVSITLFGFRHAIAGLFTGDPEVAAMAAEFLMYSAALQMFYGLYFVAYRALQAAGDMNSPMIVSISSAVFFGAPIGYFLASYGGYGATGMWIANFVYGVVITLLMTGVLMTGRWARRHAVSNRSDL